MANVIITESLFGEIQKKFNKKEAENILDLFGCLEQQPHRGKVLGNVGGIALKELKYGKFRFYFITDGYVLKYGTEDELAALLIKFVRMSDKKDQQNTIEEIKAILRSMGFDSV